MRSKNNRTSVKVGPMCTMKLTGDPSVRTWRRLEVHKVEFGSQASESQTELKPPDATA